METDNEMKRLIQRTKGNLEEREEGSMEEWGGREAEEQTGRERGGCPQQALSWGGSQGLQGHCDFLNSKLPKISILLSVFYFS